MSYDKKERNLTKEEILVEQLKSRIPEIIRDDWKYQKDVYLLQWLKARKMNVDNAEYAIRQTVKWRKENNVDALLYEEYSQEQKIFFINTRYTGTCRDGSPFFTMLAGQWDVHGFVALYGKDAFVRFMTKVFVYGEKDMIEHSEKLNRARQHGIVSKGLTGVISGTGYSLKQFRSLQTLKAAMECARVYDSYFPQHVDLNYFINVSRIFSVIMKMVTPFLRGTNHILGGDQDSWKCHLDKWIDPEQLPPDCGGTRNSNICTSKINTNN